MEELIQQQRDQLARIETNGASGISAIYKRVEASLSANLAALLEQIEVARATGEEVRPNWLVSRERYQRLLAELQEETLAFLHRAIETITKVQQDAVGIAPRNADDLTLAALGPAPQSAVAGVRSQFGRLPRRQLERLVGFAGDGKPLGDLLSELAPESVQAAKDSLAYGVATGQSPRVIARDVTARTGIAKARSLTIARTEMLRPYRSVTHERFRESNVVKSWVWLARLDGRCCPACTAMNGTVHPLGEELHSHPNCRCSAAPRTVSWAELGIRGVPDTRQPILSPQQRFDALPEADKLAIMGRARLAAYESGEITLDQMVRTTRSTRWGPGRRAATLKELGVA